MTDDLPTDSFDPDRFHLVAAEGWLELAAIDEARREFALVPPTLHNDPTALDLRFHFALFDGDHAAAIELGRQLMEAGEARLRLLRTLADLLFAHGHTAAAILAAEAALRKFPGDWQLCFALARYTCCLGHLQEAADWLRLAIRHGQTDLALLRKMAINDEVLAGLWRNLPTGYFRTHNFGPEI